MGRAWGNVELDLSDWQINVHIIKKNLDDYCLSG